MLNRETALEFLGKDKLIYVDSTDEEGVNAANGNENKDSVHPGNVSELKLKFFCWPDVTEVENMVDGPCKYKTFP